MNRSRPQSIADADRDLRQYLIRIAATLGDVLADLDGLYLYGSLATGSYRRDRSDLDLLAVTSRALTQAERQQAALSLVALSDARPTPGDLRIDVLSRSAARTFEHPMACEVRYSRERHEEIRRRRVDFAKPQPAPDLAARILEARERGVTLVGAPPDRTFAPVPWHAFIAALESEFRWARALVGSNPSRAMLDACRVLHGTTSLEMRAVNKDEAAVWALQTVPRIYHSAINDALQIYRGNKSTDDVIFEERDVIAFREYVRERSSRAFARASDAEDAAE